MPRFHILVEVIQEGQMISLMSQNTNLLSKNYMTCQSNLYSEIYVSHICHSEARHIFMPEGKQSGKGDIVNQFR